MAPPGPNKKMTIAISPAEAEFVGRKSDELVTTDTMYIRRLIGLGAAIDMLQQRGKAVIAEAADQDTTPRPHVELTIVAKVGEQVVGMHAISDMLY